MDEAADEHGKAGDQGSDRQRLAEAMGSVLDVVLRRGRNEIERVALRSRVSLERRALQRDRDAMYQKLGREVRALIEGGEVHHPGLARGVERIRELEEKLEALD